jgi:hypothetical protein
MDNLKKGILIKSTSFNETPYWVVKCDEPNLPGNRNGELPIDLLSFNYHPWMILENKPVYFELVQIGTDKQYHATIKQRDLTKMLKDNKIKFEF